MTAADPGLFHMLAVFAVITVMLFLYATEKLTVELISAGTLCALLALFQFFPLHDTSGAALVTPSSLLSGFANPALLTVLALLVMGEGLARTGVLDRLAARVHRAGGGRPLLTVTATLMIGIVASAFLNNIPVVVIFVPIIQALAARAGHAASRYMMPLSFAVILGGMTTLIGSSTNLLVSSALIQLGEQGFSFFQFTLPGLAVAAVGLLYAMLVLPRILPDRQGYLRSEGGAGGKQFQTQIRVIGGSRLEGMRSVSGFFPDVKGVTILKVVRGRHEYYPPYDDLTLEDGDILVAAATREVLAALLVEEPAAFLPDMRKASDAERESATAVWRSQEQTLSEAMVRPGSAYIGQTVRQMRLKYRDHILIVGMERRSGMSRQLFRNTVLEAGDVLLVQGTAQELESLRDNRQLLPMEWSAANLPKPHHTTSAALIFLGVVALAATGVMSTVAATLCGAVLMVLAGVLTPEGALKALDRQIIFLIACALALGEAMEKTGGAAFLSRTLLETAGGAGPAVVLSGFFLLVACMSNILSTKATAVLFTPIAVAIAHSIGVPVEPFAVAVVFAANCAFASPMGYQTNLLVMAPGHYRFADFVKFGSPMIVICWITYTLFAAWWYDLAFFPPSV